MATGSTWYSRARATSGAQIHRIVASQNGPSPEAIVAIKKARAACPDGNE